MLYSFPFYLFQNLLVSLDGFSRPCRNRRAVGADELILVFLRLCKKLLTTEGAFLEFDIRFVGLARLGSTAPGYDCRGLSGRLGRFHLDHVAGADHPLVAESLVGLARLHYHQGEYDSEKLLEMLDDAKTCVFVAGLKDVRDELDDVFSRMTGSNERWQRRRAELVAGGRWTELLY